MWLQAPAAAAGGPAVRWVLSLDADAGESPPDAGDAPWLLLSGPEGGLAPQEQDAARAAGFTPLSLGPRVLRAETAPLVALARWAR
jgi:16S rRNA (uracil1498-N3)-methyltransferase